MVEARSHFLVHFRETVKMEALRASFQQSLDELRKEKVCFVV